MEHLSNGLWVALGNNMNYKELVDPELRKYAFKHPYNRVSIYIANFILTVLERFIPVRQGVKHSVITIKGHENLDLKLDIYEPIKNRKREMKKQPCLLYFHGGAFSYKASIHHRKLAMTYAKEAGCKVVFPDYHLLPKYPYPAAYNDAISSYKYVLDHADDLGIDESRIGMAGDSAGGTLTAMVINSCEKKGFPYPVFQMLIYPLIGINLHTDSMVKYQDAPIWSPNHNELVWKLYFAGKDYDYLNSPMHSKISIDTPCTYIETAEYDSLHDEGVLYARKLEKSGIKVVLNETKGTFHGYDAIKDAKVTKDNLIKRIKYIRSIFH